MDFPVKRSDEEWKQVLTPEEYRILRLKGTEPPFSGEYTLKFESGKYSCKGCGKELFSSSSKFDSHCGWPSFDKELDSAQILRIRDTSHGMIRTEIVCSNCGGHLGHVFDDGPTETGERYCVNSLSVSFQGDQEKP